MVSREGLGYKVTTDWFTYALPRYLDRKTQSNNTRVKQFPRLMIRWWNKSIKLHRHCVKNIARHTHNKNQCLVRAVEWNGLETWNNAFVSVNFRTQCLAKITNSTPGKKERTIIIVITGGKVLLWYSSSLLHHKRTKPGYMGYTSGRVTVWLTP